MGNPAAPYEPEMGQALFGNATGSFDLGAAEGLVANELYALSETLGKRDPKAQSHGALGGEWGYGQDFANETFEMHPYWWGDCDCGYDELESAWSEAHQHKPDCFNTRYHAERERLRAAGTDWPESDSHMTVWAKSNGFPEAPYGEAVFCDCGHDALWQDWASQHGHEPTCSEARPNFRCGDVEVRWYKYIGRGMSMNREVARTEWREIFSRCAGSLAADTPVG